MTPTSGTETDTSAVTNGTASNAAKNKDYLKQIENKREGAEDKAEFDKMKEHFKLMQHQHQIMQQDMYDRINEHQRVGKPISGLPVRPNVKKQTEQLDESMKNSNAKASPRRPLAVPPVVKVNDSFTTDAEIDYDKPVVPSLYPILKQKKVDASSSLVTNKSKAEPPKKSKNKNSKRVTYPTTFVEHKPSLSDDSPLRLNKRLQSTLKAENAPEATETKVTKFDILGEPEATNPENVPEDNISKPTSWLNEETGHNKHNDLMDIKYLTKKRKKKMQNINENTREKEVKAGGKNNKEDIENVNLKSTNKRENPPIEYVTKPAETQQYFKKKITDDSIEKQDTNIVKHVSNELQMRNTKEANANTKHNKINNPSVKSHEEANNIQKNNIQYDLNPPIPPLYALSEFTEPTKPSLLIANNNDTDKTDTDLTSQPSDTRSQLMDDIKKGVVLRHKPSSNTQLTSSADEVEGNKTVG